MSSLQYKATDIVIPAPGKVELVYTPTEGGEPERYTVFEFQDGGGVTLGMYNTDRVSISQNLPLPYLFLCILVLLVHCCLDLLSEHH